MKMTRAIDRYDLDAIEVPRNLESLTVIKPDGLSQSTERTEEIFDLVLTC